MTRLSSLTALRCIIVGIFCDPLFLGYVYHVLVDDFGVDVPHIASAYSREFAKKDDSNEMQVLMAALRSLFHYNTCPVCWENENCACDNPNIFV